MSGTRIELAPFNLIVTHLPGRVNVRDAERHLEWLLDDVEVVHRATNILLAKTLNPREAVERLRRSLPASTPILRVIPVDAVSYPSAAEVKRIVESLISGQPGGSYAIKLDGHLYDEKGDLMHRVDSIKIIAEGINRPVDLSNPDVLVYIKIVKYRRLHLAGIYVGPRSGILSTIKERGEG